MEKRLTVSSQSWEYVPPSLTCLISWYNWTSIAVRRCSLIHVLQWIGFGWSFHCLNIIKFMLQWWWTRTRIRTVSNTTNGFGIKHLRCFQRCEAIWYWTRWSKMIGKRITISTHKIMFEWFTDTLDAIGNDSLIALMPNLFVNALSSWEF